MISKFGFMISQIILCDITESIQFVMSQKDQAYLMIS